MCRRNQPKVGMTRLRTILICNPYHLVPLHPKFSFSIPGGYSVGFGIYGIWLATCRAAGVGKLLSRQGFLSHGVGMPWRSHAASDECCALLSLFLYSRVVLILLGTLTFSKTCQVCTRIRLRTIHTTSFTASSSSFPPWQLAITRYRTVTYHNFHTAKSISQWSLACHLDTSPNRLQYTWHQYPRDRSPNISCSRCSITRRTGRQPKTLHRVLVDSRSVWVEVGG
jgi:hypothetical protein